MMTPSPSLKGIILALSELLGSAAQLARRLDVSDKIVREWLRKSDAELEKISTANKEKILGLAREKGIDFPPPVHENPHLWDPSKSYDENLERPALQLATPPLSFQHLGTELLGFPLASPFGPSASVLTADSSRIAILAKTGNSVLTYKTVRAHQKHAHASPNILFCDHRASDLDPELPEFPPFAVGIDEAGYQARFGMMNRFGMPSLHPESWQADFRRAKSLLDEGQVLILSVVGTAQREAPEEALVEDFGDVVSKAVSAGADIIELNLSCPNCSGPESTVFESPRLARKICEIARQRAGAVPLIAKIGFLVPRQLEEFVVNVAASVNGISAINTVPVKSFRDGLDCPEAAFGGSPDIKAGLSGKPILRLGLRTIQELRNLKTRENLKELALIGMGGITQPQHVQQYLTAGADAVQATAAFFVNPRFGESVRRLLEHQLESEQPLSSSRAQASRRNWAEASNWLERKYPGKADEISAAAIAVLLEWNKRNALENRSGPRRGSATTIEDFKATIASKAGIHLSRS
jgi:dihydroorotate dehydrogenase (NAD+) catalytic subunit